MKDSGAMGVVAGREASVGFMGKAGKAKTKICPNCGEECLRTWTSAMGASMISPDRLVLCRRCALANRQAREEMVGLAPKAFTKA